jgi:hypothetical protein
VAALGFLYFCTSPYPEMRKLNFVFFICSICFSLTHAQDFRKGFVLKTNGDSLAGFVEYRSDKKNSQACYFKTSKGSDKVKFLPTELKGYGFIDDKFYESKGITIKENGIDKRVSLFMEAIVKGKASLYRHLNQFYLEKDSLIEIPKSTPVEVNIGGNTYSGTSNEYVGILNMALADCNLKADQIKNDERNLSRLIQKYNQCKGSVSTVYKSSKPWAKVSPSIFFGVDKTNIKLAGFPDYSIQNSVSMPFGASFAISAPRLSDRFSLDVELWYVKMSFQGHSEYRGYYFSTVSSDLFINLSAIKMPIGFHYNFLQERQTPYLKFGLLHYFTLDLTAQTVDATTSASGAVTTDKSNVAVDKSNPTGLWFAAGYTKRISSKISGFGELRYESFSGFDTPTVSHSSSGSSVNFIIGLKF